MTIILLALSGVEFVIAFSAAVFTCQVACCDESGCCGDSQKGNETDIEKEHSMKHSAYMHLTEQTVRKISCFLLGFLVLSFEHLILSCKIDYIFDISDFASF